MSSGADGDDADDRTKPCGIRRFPVIWRAPGPGISRSSPTGQLDVERHVVPFDDGWVGSVTVDRACLHQVHTDAGWGVVLLPAPESGAVYFEGPPAARGRCSAVAARQSSRIAHARGRSRLPDRFSRRRRGFARASAQAALVCTHRRARKLGLPETCAPGWTRRMPPRSIRMSQSRIAGAPAALVAVDDGGCASVPMARDPRCRGAAWRWSAFGASSTSTSPKP